MGDGDWHGEGLANRRIWYFCATFKKKGQLGLLAHETRSYMYPSRSYASSMKLTKTTQYIMMKS
jgi:hypothetical protein